MKIDPKNENPLIVHSTGIGTVTRQMVHDRAVELALINGRSATEVSESDWAQAKRELTGGGELDPKERTLESAPESERWDPLPGSQGGIVPVSPVDEEDAEGRSIGERLVEEGVNEAEHDQMLQAARKAERDDRRES